MNKRHTLFQKLLITSFLLVATTPASAQLIPDSTLDQEASIVKKNTINKSINADLISGGAQRGSNLFHSFTEFSINNGQRVYFANPVGVQNILTRVTGGNASNILGTLGVDGAANLFLINPNGILFGQNASLDIQGSFVGTTANAVKFGNQGIFSATNPETAPLLTIQPSALLFNQLNQQASITNKSQAAAGVNLVGENVTGLRVPDSKSFLLVGGNINIDGSAVRAYGGNIELAGLAAPGSVDLNIADDNLSLVMPNVDRANVLLTNGAEVNVRGNNGGNININALNLDLTGESKIRAGIDTGLGTPSSQAGNISINATGIITLSDNSFIANVLQTGAFGQSGNINISTNSLNLNNNGNINVSTYGNGNAGSAFIQANGNIDLSDSGIYSTVGTGAVGNAGKIEIQTRVLSLLKGSEINTNTYGQGSGGSITINARDAISLDGKGQNIFSRITNGVSSEATGNTGDIQLTTNTLKLANGTFIDNTSAGKGNAGNINISTGSLNLENKSYIDVSNYGNGSAGNTLIQAKENINLSDSDIYSIVGTGAIGNAGNIEIQTGVLSLFEGAEINSRTYGQGNAGSITVNARDAITLDGKGQNIFSRITSGINSEATGNAGDIQLTTNNLKLSNGAFISNTSSGKGNAGNITIDAHDIALNSRSYVASSIYNQAEGKAGSIQVNTQTLSLYGGSQLSTTTSGKGDAGNITINARDSINLDGFLNNVFSGIESDVILGGIGNAGNINITTGSLQLTNGAKISSDTNGRGSAGDITVNARDTITIDGFGKLFTEQYGERNIPSSISSDVGIESIGKGGDISISARGLVIKNTGKISVDTFGQGNAGNISIKASEGVSLSSDSNTTSRQTQISSFVSSRATGNGGTINIEASKLSLDNAALSTFTFGKGNAGSIFIKANDFISLTNNGSFSSSVASNTVGNGGNIDIQTGRLFLDNRSTFFAVTNGQGSAGNISIKAADSIFLRNAFIDSSVTKEGIGNGGNINIATNALTLTDNAFLTTSISGKGKAGDVSINATGNILINNGAFVSTGTNGQGDAGKVSIRTLGDVTISGRGEKLTSLVSTGISQTGVGNGGNIEISARNFTLSNGTQLFSFTFGKGNAGSILINTLDSTTIKEAGISASTDGQGNAGKIVINALKDVSILDKSSIDNIISKSAIGNGGNIEINARNFTLSNGANFLTTTYAKGNAGNVRINTNNDITIKNASQINTSTYGEGNAGNITSNAGNTLLISGTNDNGEMLYSGIFSEVDNNTDFTGKGKSGNINVTAPNLSLNSAALSVSSSGDSAAGDININSGRVRVDNKSIIAAITNSANGGNINLTAADFLLLRNNSNISTTGGFDNESAGDGGNISVNTPFIIAVPNENSDISANAYTGKGGNVNIGARSIFGIEAQSQSTNQSDITASSRLGVQGQISITQPDINPTQAINELPTQVVDASNQIGQICPRGAYAKRQEGKFIITGRGSLPPNPLQMLPGTPSITTLATLDRDEISAKQQRQVSKSELDKNKVEITEAQGLLKNADGSIELVAMAPIVTPRANGAISTCPS